MRYVIYITIAFLSVFCFNNAMAQVSTFGTTNVNGFSKTVGTLWLSKYADADSTGNFLAVDVEGKVYKTTGGASIDTSLFLRKTDTSRIGIVTTYFYVDSLSAIKLNISDTSTMLSPYLRKGDTATMLNPYLRKGDTTAMLLPYLRDTDTTSLVATQSFISQNYFRRGGSSFGAVSAIGTNDAFRLDIEANNTTGLSVQTDGDVTVGTTTNGIYKFDVLGTSRFRGILRSDNATNNDYVQLVSSGGSPYMNIFDDGAVDLRIGNMSGFCVIGSGSLTSYYPIRASNAKFDGGILTLSQDDNAGNCEIGMLSGANSTDASFIRMASTGTEKYTIGIRQNSNFLYFRSTASTMFNGTPRVVFTDIGRVGIGDTTPTQKLHVNGKVKIDSIDNRTVITDSILVRNGGVISSRLPENYYTGWAQYIDTTYTSASPFTIPTTTTDTLENNAQSVINSQLPIDAVTGLYVAATKDIRAIDTFDSYLISIRFKAVSDFNFDNFKISLDIGGALGIIGAETRTFTKNAGNEQEFNVNFSVFSGATFIANGGTILITTNGGNISFYDINYLITRTHKAR